MATDRIAKQAISEIQKEIDEAQRKIRALGGEFGKKERRKMLTPAANVLREEIKTRAPRSEKAHHRYATAKLSEGLKAPKNEGNKVATYEPGNMARSFKLMTFRRSPDVFVGPKRRKGESSKGHFSGSQADGYYAHWVEFGTQFIPPQPFVRPSVSAAKAEVTQVATATIRKVLKDFEAKNKI